MNAVMPGSSHQFPPYGGGLAPDEGVDSHYQTNANDAANAAVNATAATANRNNNGNSNGNGNEASGPDDPGERSNPNTTNNAVAINGESSHHSTASTPPDYLSKQQHPSQPNPQSLAEEPPAPPFGGLVVRNVPPPTIDPFFHDPVAATVPWMIGSTDGSYALVNLQHHEQQIRMQQQKQQEEQEFQRRQEIQRRHSLPAGANSEEPNAMPKRASMPPGGPDAEDTNDHANAGASGGAPASAGSNMLLDQISNTAAVVQKGMSLYHDKLFHQSSSAVEAVLSATCEVMGFDIAEMWLRTGHKTHQLTNSHLRPTALQDSVRQALVDVYYGEDSNNRTHRLSPALCKRAKDANDVVWVSMSTPNGAEALRVSISNVGTAVAVPVCHEPSNTNITIIYFAIRSISVRPAAVQFLVHMSTSAAVTSVNALSTDGLSGVNGMGAVSGTRVSNDKTGKVSKSLSSSAAGDVFGKIPGDHDDDNEQSIRINKQLSKTTDGRKIRSKSDAHAPIRRPPSSLSNRPTNRTSITGARLDLEWKQLLNVEYLTDGGNSWIHTAIYDGKPVVVKTLRPECQDTAVAMNEIESEIAVHARLNHPNIVSLIGAGWTSKRARFIVLERLDGGTLTQMLGYDTRIRDRRRRFWKKKQLPYLAVLRSARSLASAMQYCNEQAIPGSMVLHRDLKPDNIGFTLEGSVKLIDFGLARILENSNPDSNERYVMSGETGSLRYMAPEVAERHQYNHKADVYSFGIILWEMNAGKRPFSGLSRDTFYEQVVYGGVRPHLSKRWPTELNKLVASCWSVDVDARPTFREIVDKIDDLLTNEKGGKSKVGPIERIGKIIDRHSTWF